MKHGLFWIVVIGFSLMGCGGDLRGDGSGPGVGEETSADTTDGAQDTSVTMLDVEAPPGKDIGGEGGENMEECIPSSEWDDSMVVGHIYYDEDQSDQSNYFFSYSSEVDVNLSSGEVALIGPGIERVTSVCSGGTFAFSDVGSDEFGGVGLIAPVYPNDSYCTTKNCPRRLPNAIREGAVSLLTFGDSVPVVGSNVLFPAHLGATLDLLAETTSMNVAVGGTTSDQWLPGTNLFDNDLIPLVPDADVVIVSLGGNDVMQYVGEATSGGDIMGAINNLEPFVLGIMDNVLLIASEIRVANPDVDIVYCLYPNYALSQEWEAVFAQIPLPGVQDLVVGLVVDALDLVRSSIGAAEDIVLVDFYGAMDKTQLDNYLYDQLHFNEAGHVYYATEIFRALGGVKLNEGNSVGKTHVYGLTDETE
jgi:hypothetical protein